MQKWGRQFICRELVCSSWGQGAEARLTCVHGAHAPVLAFDTRINARLINSPVVKGRAQQAGGGRAGLSGCAAAQRRRSVLAVVQGAMLLALLDGGLQQAGVPGARAGRSWEEVHTTAGWAAARSCARQAGKQRSCRRSRLPAHLRGGQARNGHAQRGAGHVVHHGGHKLNRLGVAAMLACRRRGGGGGGRGRYIQMKGRRGSGAEETQRWQLIGPACVTASTVRRKCC